MHQDSIGYYGGTTVRSSDTNVLLAAPVRVIFNAKFVCWSGGV